MGTTSPTGGWTWKHQNIPFTIDYSQQHQAVKLTTSHVKDTEYKFTLYGAAAGDAYNYPGNARGGKGGRVTGVKKFQASTDLYVYVGGRGGKGYLADQDGNQAQYNYAGWNGGGKGTRGGSGGGGCTDIRTTLDNVNTRLLVAGGGGGCGSGMCGVKGGHGGGLTGVNAGDNQAYGK
jgi:hypothetical protein